jgi:hypothetical protein
MTAKIGFLTVRKHNEHGYFGGYLLVNHLARPLEFHCTLPVRPSRAQSLLYGPTIDDFVCGEQIAGALVTKARVKPDLLITDTAPMLALCVVSKVPIVQLVVDAPLSDTAPPLSTPVRSNIATRAVTHGNEHFRVPEESDLQDDHLLRLVGSLAETFELGEPFQRIVDALLEAHPIAKAA